MNSKFIRLSGLFLAVLWSSFAYAEERLAILEFRNIHKATTADESAYIAEIFRDLGAKLEKRGLIIMTKENILQLLPPGKTLEQCLGECEVETGRKIGADYVLSGEILKLGAELGYRVTAKIHKTRTAALLSSEIYEGLTFKQLEQDIRSNPAKDVFRSLRKGPAAAPAFEERGFGDKAVSTPTWQSSSTIVEFRTEPPGALVEIDGGVACQQTPCSREVLLGAHEMALRRIDYLPLVENLDVISGQKPVVRTLEADFGLVVLKTEPAEGLDVFLDNKPIGTTPVKEIHVGPGPHRILVKHASYYEKGLDFSLERGKAREISLRPDAKVVAVRIGAKDSNGNDVVATVRIDNKIVGKTPFYGSGIIGSHDIFVDDETHGTWSGTRLLTESASKFELSVTLSRNALLSFKSHGKCGFFEVKARHLDHPVGEGAGDSHKDAVKYVQRKVVIEPKFDEAYSFDTGQTITPAKLGKKWGYIDRKGNFVIKPMFDSAERFIEGFDVAPATLSEKWGFIDHQGNFVIRPYWKDVDWRGPPIDAWGVSGSGFVGVVGRQGQYVFKVRNEGPSRLLIQQFCEAFHLKMLCRFNTAISDIFDAAKVEDDVGKRLDKIKFDREFDLAAIKVGEKWGYIYSTGKWAIEPIFTGVRGSDRKFGLAPVGIGDQWGYINRKGKYIIKAEFRIAHQFSEESELAIVYDWALPSPSDLDNKVPAKMRYGFIKPSGQFEHVPDFEDAYPFDKNTGLAKVKIKEKIGFIDRKGHLAIGPIFDHALSFSTGKLEDGVPSFDGLAWVETADKYGLVDAQGKFIVPLYDSCQEVNVYFESVKEQGGNPLM